LRFLFVKFAQIYVVQAPCLNSNVSENSVLKTVSLAIPNNWVSANVRAFFELCPIPAVRAENSVPFSYQFHLARITKIEVSKLSEHKGHQKAIGRCVGTAVENEEGETSQSQVPLG
jgi:hypothetical protein